MVANKEIFSLSFYRSHQNSTATAGLLIIFNQFLFVNSIKIKMLHKKYKKICQISCDKLRNYHYAFKQKLIYLLYVLKDDRQIKTTVTLLRKM